MRRLALSILLLISTPAWAQSDEARDIRSQSLALFGKQDYVSLNALESRFRDGSKTTDGIPKLSLFYAAFEGLLLGDMAKPGETPNIFRYVEKWQAVAPSPAAIIVNAQLHLEYAWEQHGAAETVSPEGMKAFVTHVAIAKKMLEDGKEVASVDPHWSELLAAVERASAPAVAVSKPLTLPAAGSRDENDELTAEVQVRIKARLLFQAKNYVGLNDFAEALRTSGDKTPAGEDKLHEFYRGIIEFAGYESPSLTRGPNVRQWQVMMNEADDWVKKAPSPAAYITVARMRIAYAGAWRGTEFASATSSQQMQKFESNMKIARDYLLAHKSDARVDPEWHVAMIYAERGAPFSEKQMSAEITEALTDGKYYFPIYGAFATNMLPKWFGSWDAVEQFAQLAAKNTEDKMGMSFYARVYLKVFCACDEISGNEMNWALMKRGMEDFQARYPVQYNLNRYGFAACVAQDRNALRTILPKIIAVRAAAWSDTPGAYEACKAWAFGKGPQDPVEQNFAGVKSN